MQTRVPDALGPTPVWHLRLRPPAFALVSRAACLALPFGQAQVSTKNRPQGRFIARTLDRGSVRCGGRLLDRVEQAARLGMAQRWLIAAVVVAVIGGEGGRGGVGRRFPSGAVGGLNGGIHIHRGDVGHAALVKVGLHDHLVHGRRHGRVTRATAQQHTGFGRPAEQVVLLPAWYSGLLPPCWAPVRKAGWNSASRAWFGVPPGRLPDVTRVVVVNVGLGSRFSM